MGGCIACPASEVVHRVVPCRVDVRSGRHDVRLYVERGHRSPGTKVRHKVRIVKHVNCPAFAGIVPDLEALFPFHRYYRNSWLIPGFDKLVDQLPEEQSRLVVVYDHGFCAGIGGIFLLY